jgi:hypothetical protein
MLEDLDWIGQQQLFSRMLVVHHVKDGRDGDPLGDVAQM